MAASKSRDAVAEIEEFNRTLKRLACDLAAYYPADVRICRIKKQVLLAVDLTPAFVINTVGPVIYNYRDQICAGDDSFFLERQYEADLSRCNQLDRAEAIAYIIPKVKEAWARECEDKRQIYRDAVRDLLEIYIEYLYLTNL